MCWCHLLGQLVEHTLSGLQQLSRILFGQLLYCHRLVQLLQLTHTRLRQFLLRRTLPGQTRLSHTLSEQDWLSRTLSGLHCLYHSQSEMTRTLCWQCQSCHTLLKLLVLFVPHTLSDYCNRWWSYQSVQRRYQCQLLVQHMRCQTAVQHSHCCQRAAHKHLSFGCCIQHCLAGCCKSSAESAVTSNPQVQQQCPAGCSCRLVCMRTQVLWM